MSAPEAVSSDDIKISRGDGSLSFAVAQPETLISVEWGVGGLTAKPPKNVRNEKEKLLIEKAKSCSYLRSFVVILTLEQNLMGRAMNCPSTDFLRSCVPLLKALDDT